MLKRKRKETCVVIDITYELFFFHLLYFDVELICRLGTDLHLDFH